MVEIRRDVAIYCPKCKRKVMTHDGKGKIPLRVGCKNCKKVVCYNPKTKEVTITSVPERHNSNQTRLWF